MAHRVQSVSMIDQNILQAMFIGGEVIQYDLRKMLSILPQFQEIINDPSLASKVHADTGGYGVSWNDDLDLDSETIWEDGVFIRIESVDPSLALASSLARAREYAMLTQKQLSEKTGIYQSDISKLERGNANPSISTLKRLADAMDMTLKIEFVPITTTGLAGGLFTPYKGSLPALESKDSSNGSPVATSFPTKP